MNSFKKKKMNLLRKENTVLLVSLLKSNFSLVSQSFCLYCARVACVWHLCCKLMAGSNNTKLSHIKNPLQGTGKEYKFYSSKIPLLLN